MLPEGGAGRAGVMMDGRGRLYGLSNVRVDVSQRVDEDLEQRLPHHCTEDVTLSKGIVSLDQSYVHQGRSYIEETSNMYQWSSDSREAS